MRLAAHNTQPVAVGGGRGADSGWGAWRFTELDEGT